MIYLKNTVSLLCIMGALLGQGSFYSSLAMEVDSIEEHGSMRNKGAVAASVAREGNVLADDNAFDLHGATVPADSVSRDERIERLMCILTAHQRLPVNPDGGPVGKEAFFFVTIPSSQMDRREGALPSTQYKITFIENVDGAEMTSLPKGALEELGNALFVVLPGRSGHLGWSDTLRGIDYPMGPFADGSFIKSTHLFSVSNPHKKVMLREYIEEGVWVGRQETTLQGTSRLEEKEILLCTETDFSPIHCTLSGLVYGVDPRNRRVFVMGLAQSPFFAEPQFVWMGIETTLEQRSWADLPPKREGQGTWRALASWIYVDPSEPFYYLATYPLSSPTFEYDIDWWRNWVEGSFESEQVGIFLRNFEESMLARRKEKGLSAKATILGRESLPAGFFQVLLTSPFPGGNYGYVDLNEKLYAAEGYELVLRGEGQLTTFSVTAYRKGSTCISRKDGPLFLRRLSSCSRIPVRSVTEEKTLEERKDALEEPESMPEEREEVQWGDQRGFYEVRKAEDGERIFMRPQNGDEISIKTRDLGIQTKGNEDVPLLEVLGAATLEHVSFFTLEGRLIPEGLMFSLSDIMGRWVHLRELALRNCFDEKTLSGDAAQKLFNALRDLRNLEELDFSGNPSEMETFRTLLLTLLAGGPEKLESISLSLPYKPKVDGKRATTGSIVGGGVAFGALVGSMGGLPGMAVGAVVGGGGAMGGALVGGASRKVRELSKRNAVSFWAVDQLEPLVHMSSLRTLNVFGVRKWEEGRNATREVLENMRQELGLSPITFALYREVFIPF